MYYYKYIHVYAYRQYPVGYYLYAVTYTQVYPKKGKPICALQFSFFLFWYFFLSFFLKMKERKQVPKNWELQMLWCITFCIPNSHNIIMNFRALAALCCTLKGDFRHKISLSSGAKRRHKAQDAQNSSKLDLGKSLLHEICRLKTSDASGCQPTLLALGGF